MPNLPLEALRGLCTEILEALGSPKSVARIVCDALLTANLRGVDSHGIRLLPLYVKRVRAGFVNPKARVRLIKEDRAIALMDGACGFGQVVGVKGMERTIKEAKRYGIALTGLLNVNHMGMMAYYGLQAVKKGIIGIAACNTPALMAPYGGRDKLLGSNPLCIAIPTGEAPPLVLDMALTHASAQKVLRAIDKGEPIPEGWGIDEEGRSTTDPTKLFRDGSWLGSLLPTGGHKGYALALAIEVLCSALIGGSFSKDIPLLLSQNFSLAGAVMIGIDPSSFQPLKSFQERMDELYRAIKAVRPAPGHEEVLAPGERERRTEERRREEGIPLSEKEWASIKEVANSLGIEVRI